ncbi:Uncharacterized protein HZ326_23576 [Fusarium oxysporum f. sp. albedinis]|nr:Uncharacterized protein HZ326_23576 [Fusarium oxysporum f. sp. albedinis]KAK2477819.1 hypothetical protein H9L39_10307 [Fusarium oxysporum f. sp. albedinis]
MLYKTSPIVSKRLYDRTETDSIDNLESSGHSWSPVAQAGWKHPVDKPLLRTWDDLSGSQPDGSGDMSARASDIPLTTFEARRSSHQTHIIHRNWAPTPYISFTSSPEALENLASQLQKVSHQKKALTTYAFGQSKQKKSLSITTGTSFFSDPNWYHNIVRPDIKRFREERQRREQEQVQHRIDDISAAFGTLPLDGSLSPSSSTASDHNTDNEYWEDTDRNQPTKQHIQSFL